MRLLDLDPRWFVLEDGGRRVGLTFMCPHCRDPSIRLAIAFHHSASAPLEDAYIMAKSPGTAHIWTVVGADDFAAMTLTPSVDASGSGHWHGFVTNGVVS